MNETQIYWAAEQDEKKLGAHLSERKKAHQQWLLGSDALKWMRKSHRMYLGEAASIGDATGREVKRTGKAGAVLKVNANDYGAILRSVVTLTTAQEISFQPRARNSDGEAQSIVTIGTDLLDWYMSEELGRRFAEQAKHAVKFGRGWLLKLADEMEGDEVPAEMAGPEQIIRDENGGVVAMAREGRHVFHNLTPLDVYYDFSSPDPDACGWHIARTWANKWDLAAKCAARKLLEQPAPVAMEGAPKDPRADVNQTESKLRKILGAEVSGDDSSLMLEDEWKNKKSKSDLIPVFVFLHKKSHALPEGRFVMFLDDGTVLEQGPLKYPEYPLFALEPDKRDGSAEGHAPAWDLMGLQDAENAALGLALTKENNSLPVICFPKGSGVSVSDLAIPYAAVNVNSKDDMPQVLVSTVSGEQSVALAGTFQRRQETISGINPVVRGNPSEALNGTASGTAYALIAEQAYQSNTPLLASYKRLHQQVGKATLADYPVFFPGSRKLKSVAGKARGQMVTEFEGASLEAIESVEVDAGNPAARSLSSRMALMEVLQKSGAQIEPDRLVEVFQTGKWDPAIEHLQSEAKQIREENEAMAAGQEIPPAALGEHHLHHIRGHIMRTVADKLRGDLDMRLAHIQTHLDLIAWPVMSPEVAVELGMMGFMPPPGAVPMGASNGTPPPIPGDGANSTKAAAPLDGAPVGPPPGSLPNLPNLPEPAKPPGGPLQ